MVLSNATVDDGSPTSDGDLYDLPHQDDSGKSGHIEVDVDTTNFPRPMPILGALFGFTNTFYSKALHARFQSTMNHINRPLTQDEANALAYWTAKQISVMSYGGPIGVLGGAYQARRTMSNFRFPFYQPNLESFPKESWPSARMALQTGPRATFIWHLSRFMCYGIVGNFLGAMFFASYAMSVTAVGELQDGRLKDMVKALREAGQVRRGQLPNQPRQPGMVDEIQEKDASSLWADYRKENGDDSSPTTEADENSEGPTESAPVSRSPTPYATMPRSMQTSTQPRPNQQPNNSNPTASFFGGDDDDASPTGGQGMRQDTQQGGSAWDRVRRQANTQSSGNKASSWPIGEGSIAMGQRAWARGKAGVRDEQQDGAAVGDDFPFPSAKRERQTAKDNAQKEFDARVERERGGGDFSVGGDQKRW